MEEKGWKRVEERRTHKVAKGSYISKYFSGFLIHLFIKRKPLDNVKRYCILNLIVLINNFKTFCARPGEMIPSVFVVHA